MKKISLSKTLREYYGSSERIKKPGKNCIDYFIISDYIKNELLPLEKQKVEKHIYKCESCFSKVFQLSESFKILDKKEKMIACPKATSDAWRNVIKKKVDQTLKQRRQK
jgi:DNA-directed RNA polymerase subunit RPC12/RpoP